jgi:hypothetical protein
MDVRPLWACPRCEKSYVTRNASHSCVVVPLDDHFAGRPRARQLFDALVAVLEADGPVTVSVSTSRIELMKRARFAHVPVRRDYLRLHLWLKRRAASSRFVKVQHYGRDDWGHTLVVRDETDLDDELRALLRESRRVGDQLR